MKGILFADGFDEAIVGYCYNTGRVIYDVQKMIGVLVNRDGMDVDEAIEFLEYNTFGSYMGEGTPIYMNRSTKEYIEQEVAPNYE